MPYSIQFFRSVPRWLMTRTLAKHWPSVATGAMSCIREADLPPPVLPGRDWVRLKTRLSGICGSDLSAIACKGSPYFSPFVSTPFVPGHEIVGDIVECGADVPSDWKSGARVVIEPALCCRVRGVTPECAPCARGNYANCENITKGVIPAGIQTGYCEGTGGGWSQSTVIAHHSQLYAVPQNLSDEEAVLAEPLACAIHAALKMPMEESCTTLLLGAGTIGLLTLYAYRAAGGRGKVFVAARYTRQAEMAIKLGATEVCRAKGFEELYRWVLERTAPGKTPAIYRPELGKPVLLGGTDCTVDCVGSSDSIDDALRLTAPRGHVILSGMPGIPSGIDWTSIWYKELQLQGSYAYGWENINGRRVKTMALALEYLLSGNGLLKSMVSKPYPLQAYRSALDEAFNAGRRGTFKTVFNSQA